MNRNIHRSLLALLLIFALAAPAVACLGSLPGEKVKCADMDCCNHTSAPVAPQSMKNCECRTDDATQQLAISSAYHVSLAVIDMISIGAPAEIESASTVISSDSASPPASGSSTILRL